MTPDLDRIREGVRLMALKRLADAAAADEIAQETVVRLLEALESRDEPPDHVAAFARGIALNVIADQMRSRGREVSLDSAALRQGMPASHGKNPLALLITAEERAAVREALEALDPTDREILRLSFFEGRRPQEIAALNGDPAARIRKRKSRALERLRRIFLARHEVAARETTP